MKTTNITLRNSVRQELAAAIPDLITQALNWMQNKYPTVKFDTVEFIFSAGYSRSRYFRNKAGAVRTGEHWKAGKYTAPNVCISTRATLYLYDMKSLNIKKRTLFVGSPVQIICALIHELTHHVQYELKLPHGELATTANELEYLKENQTKFYNKIVKKVK